MLQIPLEMLNDIQQSATNALVASVDSHVEANHSTVVMATADGPAAPGTSQFCIVYTTARPILVFVKGMLFFRPKWQTIVTALIAGLDTVCPQS